MSYKACYAKWPKPDPDLTSNVLNKEYFDDLWSLILNENKCAVPFEHENQFVPQPRFNDWLCHSVLAQNCFKDYQLPLLVQWRHQYPPLPSLLELQSLMKPLSPRPPKIGSRSKSPRKAGHKSQHRKYKDFDIIMQLEFEKFSADDEMYKSLKDCTNKLACEPPRGFSLGEIQKLHNEEAARRLKLSDDFLNRKYPWYKERPAYEKAFNKRNADEISFNKDTDWNMLYNIYQFNCRLIILNLSTCIGMDALKPWLKYANHAGIVVVTHDPNTFRKLSALHEYFVPCFVQENLENTWQEELESALKHGLECAKAVNMYKDCMKAFIYVFSEERGSNEWNTYKIMRKRNAVV